MTQERIKVPVGRVCTFFEKSRQAYYQVLHRKDEVAVEKEVIIGYVKEHRKEMPKLGTRKLYYLLQPLLEKSEIKCGRDKLFSILRDNGLLQQRRRAYCCSTNSLPLSREFPNLVKDMMINAPEQVWVSDTTWLPVRDGFGYLTLTTDLYSKKVMGYNLQRTKQSSGSLKTLSMALSKRMYPERQLTHHSDGGGEYFNRAFLQTLKDAHVRASCTAPSSPQENAVAERINGILKNEFLLIEANRSYEDIADILPAVIKTYNERRPHTSIDLKTPNEAHSYVGTLRRRWKTYRRKRKEGNRRISWWKRIQQTMNSWDDIGNKTLKPV